MAAALACTALVLGCSGSAANQAASPQKVVAGSTVAAQAPVIQYGFYAAASEQALQAETEYGYLIAKVRTGAKTQMFTDEGLEIAGRFEQGDYTFYHLKKATDLMGTMERLKTVSGLVYVEPDVKLTMDAGLAYSNPDPRAVSEEYSLALTKTKEAWATYGFGPFRPVVADVDSGINFAHEDLKDVVKHAYSWYDLSKANALIDGTANNNVQPIDYISGALFTNTDDIGHGSHTAGTIAASGNNGKGVAGVCWQADLVSYKGLLNGSGGTWGIYGSMYHLIQWKKANYPHTIAVNMSLGGNAASQFAVDMVELGLENNVVVIASMGNDGQRMAKYPAAYAGVIAVGATNGQDKKVHFSTAGRNISVSAPGYNIISTYNGSTTDYQSDSGTSMSAPFVTGLVTYMLTFAPDLSPAQIKTYLEANTDLIEGATGFTQETGWGRVNVLKTIAAVVKDVNAGTVPASAYVNAPLAVTVNNNFLGGTVGYSNVATNLYSCDATGAIKNYIASSLTDAGAVAYFNLLRPGTYTVETVVQGYLSKSSLFQVEAGRAIPAQTISYALPIYNIATLQDAGTALNPDGSPVTDTKISVYNAAGTLILNNYDAAGLDTAQVILTPGTYRIRILPYLTLTGEYALWVGATTYPYPLAPGSFATPILGGSVSHALATPQAIVPMQIYNGNLTAAGDFYTITIP
jgi:thermitase